MPEDVDDSEESEELIPKQVYQASKILGSRLDKFSGNEDKTFEEFLDEYKDIVKRFAISHAVAKKLLPLFLSGGAKFKYQQIPNHDKMTWRELVTELATRLKNDSLLSNIRDELHHMTQGKDSVGEFAKKIYNKTKIAFQGQGEKVVTRMAIDFFIKGLNPEIRKTIRRLPDTDEFEAIVCRAEKEHRILEQERNEDRETLQAVNALLTDEKINRLEQELSRMKVASPRKSNAPQNKYRQGQRMMRFVPRSFTNQRGFYPRRPFFRQRSFPFTNRTPSTNTTTMYNGYGTRTRTCTCGLPPYYAQNAPLAYGNPASVQPTTGSARAMNATPGVHLLCIMTLICSTLVNAEYQICGINPYSNIFSLPKAIDCSIPANAPMLRTTAYLFADNPNPSWQNATKCYRDAIEVSVSSFLRIRTTTTILRRRRLSIPREACQMARITGKIHGHELFAQSDGLWTTNEIEDDDVTIPLWGTSNYLRSVYSLEEGQIATFDGHRIISSLGDTTNCSYLQGVCLSREYTIVWEPIEITPSCRFRHVGIFEAFVTLDYVVLPHPDLIFQFSEDHLLHDQLTEFCRLGNNYLTTSNHILSFPDIPQDLTIQDYVLRVAHRRRRAKRAIRYHTDKQGNTYPVEIVAAESVLLIKRLFGVKKLKRIPVFNTRPITWTKILAELQRWNISNADLARTARLYRIDDPRHIVLRTIRYGEYRMKQLRLFRQSEEVVPLNYAQLETRRDLELGISTIFDEYLNEEFGKAEYNVPEPSSQDWKLTVPYFNTTISRTTTTERDTQRTTVTPTTAGTRAKNITTPALTTTSSTSPSTILLTTTTSTVKSATPPTATSMTSTMISSTTSMNAPIITTTTTMRTSTAIDNPTMMPSTKGTSLTLSTTHTAETTTPQPVMTTETEVYYHTPLPTLQPVYPSSTNALPTTSTTTIPTRSQTPTPTPEPQEISMRTTRFAPIVWTVPVLSAVLSPILQTTTREYEVSTTTETTTFTTTPSIFSVPAQSPATENVPTRNLAARRHFNNICVRRFLESQKIRLLSSVDPTWAARILLGRSDIAAIRIADNLLVTKCRQLTPTFIYDNHTIDGTCYTLMPVRINNDLWFNVPGTQDLIQSSGTVPCPYPSPKRANMTRSLLLPNTVINNHAKPFLFDSPPTFYRILENHALSAIPYMEALKEEQVNMAVRLQKRGIIEETVSRIRNTSMSVGQSLLSLYESTTQKLSEGVEDIKWSILYTVLWIAIPATIIFLCVVACVIYAKLFFLRRATSTAASAMFSMARNFAPKRRSRRPRTVNMLMVELPQEADEQEQLFVPRIYAVEMEPRNLHLPYLEVKIGTNSVTALLDSGAAISYMRMSTLSMIGNSEQLMRTSKMATTANGTMIQLVGSLLLPVRVGTHTIMHWFYVSEEKDCPAPLLLGSDFIQALNENGLLVSLDLYNNIIRIGPETINLVPLSYITLAVIPPYAVRLAKDVFLPPRTSNVVEAHIEGLTWPRCKDFFIEDNLRPMDDIFVIGRALVTPDLDGVCYVNILNPSMTSILLPRQLKVAWAYPACESEVLVRSLECSQTQHPTEPSENNAHQPAAATVAYVNELSLNEYGGYDHIPPEADWESRLPRFPVIPNPPNYDITKEIDLSQSSLTDDQKDQLRDILRRHTDAFVGPDGHLGHYRGKIRHRIDLIENAIIPARKIYRVPLEKRQEIEKQITQMLNDGIIRESSSPFCAPIVLVKKREANSWRFTIDFRGLNAITKPQQSILPNIQDIIDLCANQCLYSSLDFQQGFHQIPLEEEHCERTAFACFLGAFEYIRMPMGLKGAPATFQRIMDDFKKYIRARVFIYIDDLIITSETPEEHLADIDEVLGKIEIIGMKLKASKCEFAKEEIKFLGFILSKEGIRPNPDKTKAIDDYPQPTNPTDVKSFLGMCSFFRRFVHNFAAIAAPLIALTKKNIPFEWTPQCEDAMKRLKKALTSAPILAAPRLGKPFIIETDSSAKGIAGVLKQEQEGLERVIAYASRTLSKHEARYPAIELEALGLVFAVQKFRPYIDGAKCTIITDHAPLKALLHRKDLTGRLAKYQIVLQEFDVSIIYRPGKKNAVCDALSRHLPLQTNAITSITTDDLQMDTVRKEQDECEWIARLKATLANNEDTTESSNYLLINDILYRLPNRLYQDPQLVLPETSRVKQDIIALAHQSQLASAHLGINKTHAAVEKIAIWNCMRKDIAQFIGACQLCQARKDPTAYKTREPLHFLEVSTRPWQRVHSDIIGPLPLTLDGNKYIIVFIDSFSKYIVAEPIPDQKADTTSRIFITRFVARFGLPETLVTDQGTNYMSETFRGLLHSLHVNHHTSTPYHHQSNGQVERVNRTLEEQIAIATRQRNDEWDYALHLIVHACNSAENASTKFSPFFLIHGREPTNIFHLALQLPTKKYADPDDYVNHLTNTLKTIYQQVYGNLVEAQKRQKHHYDLRKKPSKMDYQIGKKVWIRKDGVHKLAAKFEGPFPIIDMELPNITIFDGKRKRIIHVDRTKLHRDMDNTEEVTK